MNIGNYQYSRGVENALAEVPVEVWTRIQQIARLKEIDAEAKRDISQRQVRINEERADHWELLSDLTPQGFPEYDQAIQQAGIHDDLADQAEKREIRFRRERIGNEMAVYNAQLLAKHNYYRKRDPQHFTLM